MKKQLALHFSKCRLLFDRGSRLNPLNLADLRNGVQRGHNRL